MNGVKQRPRVAQASGHSPPHSIEAEQAVLGSLMMDQAAWAKVVGLVRAEDFYRPDHRRIFDAIGSLATDGKPCDAVSVSEHLEGAGHLADVGGLSYLGELAGDTPTAANVVGYAERIKERSILRELGALGPEVVRSIEDGEPSERILARMRSRLDRLDTAKPRPVEPLHIEPVSAWAERAPPPPRDCIAEGLAINAGRVASLLGNGGFGKSTIATQILVACASSTPLWGMPVAGGPAVGILCEDEQEEVERKTRIICDRQDIDLAVLDNLHLLSRDGEDNVLAYFDRDLIQLTAAYWRLDATLAQIRPRLLVWDTLADGFAGNMMDTGHVRQFIKTGLGGLCNRHGTAILLLAHPSAAGMSSGDGAGFSTAWNNSVRSRLYLRAPKTEDKEAAADRRVLEVKKSNYGPTGATIPLIYDRGQFVVDPEPIEESAKLIRGPKSDTRLSLAVMAYFRARAASGQVVSFGNLFETLQAAGDIARGNYETVRKPLQRSLKALAGEGLLRLSDVPRGYRIAQEVLT